jgi:hypothetical protein
MSKALMRFFQFLHMGDEAAGFYSKNKSIGHCVFPVIESIR